MSVTNFPPNDSVKLGFIYDTAASSASNVLHGMYQSHRVLTAFFRTWERVDLPFWKAGELAIDTETLPLISAWLQVGCKQCETFPFVLPLNRSAKNYNYHLVIYPVKRSSLRTHPNSNVVFPIALLTLVPTDHSTK